jgi:hypothetical protein
MQPPLGGFPHLTSTGQGVMQGGSQCLVRHNPGTVRSAAFQRGGCAANTQLLPSSLQNVAKAPGWLTYVPCMAYLHAGKVQSHLQADKLKRELRRCQAYT